MQDMPKTKAAAFADFCVATTAAFELQRKVRHTTETGARLELVKLFEGDLFGCQKTNALILTQKLLPCMGQPPLDAACLKSLAQLPPGLVIMLLSNPNAHNYGQRPLLIRRDNDTMTWGSGAASVRADGTWYLGNNFVLARTTWRVAKPRTIRDFVAKLIEAGYDDYNI